MKSEVIKINKIQTNNGQIKGLPKNPRFIKTENFERLKQSIADFPEMLELREIVVFPSADEFVCIGGNMRFRACHDLGLKEIPAKILPADFPPEKLAEFAIKDNSSFGENDWDLLCADWSEFEDKLESWGVDLPTEWLSPEENKTDEEYQAEESAALETLNRAAQLKEKFGVELGQIWQIGNHRLLVGDCTDKELFGLLMDGKTADLLNTDPPYGISIVSVKNNGSTDFSEKVGASKAFGAKSKNQIIQSNIYPVIEGDDKPFEPEFLLNLAPIVVLWGANYYADKLPTSSGWIVWDKRENITRNNFADCELAWSNQDKTAKIFYHLWNGLHKGSQNGERRTHPTEKPIALFAEIGKLFADKGLWLDLYAGTGAQIIAAEKTDASCFAAEIEPLYAAVILERMKDLFPNLEVKQIES